STTGVTTVASTSAGPTVSGSTTESTVAVMYPKDMEDVCQQTVGIMSAVAMLFMMPIQALAMYAAFTKYATMFNPVNIKAKTRHQLRMKRILQR
ncbi:unnamed protein product, partial [Adineta ricciae]